ncbi:MAG: YraN family protein [Clostridia bacterium]|nr:YraN family protein [Clostridia bacterium]
MMQKRDMGNKGEDAAVRSLKRMGYKIKERNYSVPLGEIDIIATDGEYTCFVEVKMRKNTLYGAPVEFVDKRKRQRIIKAAMIYMKTHGISDMPLRFDVVSIIGDAEYEKQKSWEIEVIKNAFSVSDI